MEWHHRAAISYHPDFLGYDFGPQHPLRPERVTLGLDLLEQLGIWDPGTETLSPVPATREELQLVHDAAYIRVVEGAGSEPFPASELALHGFGSGDNPPFPGMHEAAALISAGSLQSVRQIMNGQLVHAFNPAGGLHHALKNRASGFCIYNDPALAAAAVVHEFGGRVLYVDFDCHHGDGVQWLFYDDPRVLTVSFHESGRFLFPGTGDVSEAGDGSGLGFAVNIPMAPFTQDESWLECVQHVFPPLMEQYRPDIILSSHGADTHHWDPLTHLSLTTHAFVEQAKLVHSLAHQYCEGRWLAMGSGGYDWRRVVPRAWAIVWAEMTGRSLDDRLPASWIRRWEGSGTEPLPVTFSDTLVPEMPLNRQAEIVEANRETLRAAERIRELIPTS